MCGRWRQVYAFDPTTPYASQLDSNVTFRCWGLTGDPVDTIKGSDPLDNSEMGVVLGPLASLNNIMLALGHHGRDIQMLKIDCTSPWRHDRGTRSNRSRRASGYDAGQWRRDEGAPVGIDAAWLRLGRSCRR